MKRVETRVQQVMAAIGALLALAVFTPALFAEDPPPGANYQGFNQDLTWDQSGGQGTEMPGTVCVQQPACLQANFCYTPYNAVFGSIQYRSMKPTQAHAFGLCQLPLPPAGSGPGCTQLPTVTCAVVDLWTLEGCTGIPLTKFVYRRNACTLM